MSELAASGPASTGAEAAPGGGTAGDGTAGAATVAAVRAFNRFYTNTIGLLRGKYLDTAYSLTEARILFELAQRDASEAADLRRTVDIDTGYLSPHLEQVRVGRPYLTAAIRRRRAATGHPAGRSRALRGRALTPVPRPRPGTSGRGS